MGEERRKDTGISTDDSGALSRLLKYGEQRQAGIGAFNSTPGHTRSDLGEIRGTTRGDTQCIASGRIES
jgi:hypothetical protein